MWPQAAAAAVSPRSCLDAPKNTFGQVSNSRVHCILSGLASPPSKLHDKSTLRTRNIYRNEMHPSGLFDLFIFRAVSLVQIKGAFTRSD